jgi:hypothetical protein
MALKKKRSTPNRHRSTAAPAAVSTKRTPEEVAKIVAEVGEIARKVAAMPTLHDVDPDEWLYDERGLPH